MKLENHKGALPLSLFGDGEHETDNSLISQNALTSNPAPTTRDSTKKSSLSNISINDLISSLYSQAEQNTSVNPIQTPSDDRLGSTQKAVLVDDDDGDFDDDSWEFKGSLSRSIGESQTSTPADEDSHIRYSTDVELKEYADFYSKLKDELYVVARCHLDNLKVGRFVNIFTFPPQFLNLFKGLNFLNMLCARKLEVKLLFVAKMPALKLLIRKLRLVALFGLFLWSISCFL